MLINKFLFQYQELKNITVMGEQKPFVLASKFWLDIVKSLNSVIVACSGTKISTVFAK